MNGCSSKTTGDHALSLSPAGSPMLLIFLSSPSSLQPGNIHSFTGVKRVWCLDCVQKTEGLGLNADRGNWGCSADNSDKVVGSSRSEVGKTRKTDCLWDYSWTKQGPLNSLYKRAIHLCLGLWVWCLLNVPNFKIDKLVKQPLNQTFKALEKNTCFHSPRKNFCCHKKDTYHSGSQCNVGGQRSQESAQ